MTAGAERDEVRGVVAPPSARGITWWPFQEVLAAALDARTVAGDDESGELPPRGLLVLTGAVE